jgi:hypothetical protein
MQPAADNADRVYIQTENLLNETLGPAPPSPTQEWLADFFTQADRDGRAAEYAEAWAASPQCVVSWGAAARCSLGPRRLY